MKIIDLLAKAIYTGLGLGLMPKAPGTFGTLLGLPIYYLIKDFSLAHYLLVLGLICLLGLWAGGRAEKDLGRHDAPQVVIDEVAGYLVTMFMIPPLPYAMLWGFIFFRLFDIFKPFPVSWADEKVPGALGVMLDDILAGLYALGCMHILALLI